MEALIITLCVVGGVVLLVALLQLWAKAHTRRRANQVWAPIERQFGRQARVD